MRTPYYYDNGLYLKAFRDNQIGGGFGVFAGARRQRGGGALGTAFRFLSKYGFPVLRKLVGPGSRILSTVMEDVKTNKTPWPHALKSSLKKELFGGSRKRTGKALKKPAKRRKKISKSVVLM